MRILDDDKQTESLGGKRRIWRGWFPEHDGNKRFGGRKKNQLCPKRITLVSFRLRNDGWISNTAVLVTSSVAVMKQW